MRKLGGISDRIGALVLVLSMVSLAAPAVTDWHETVTPHFRARHEAAFGPPGFSLALEKIHNRLRLDLAMFSPWMGKERITLHLYATPASYFKGEFKPPSWSNGVAYYERKLVVVYDQPDRKKLLEVIGHEMTHLLFESYWGEVHKMPPHWLNEGLAMLEESERSGDTEGSEWSRAMALLPRDRVIAFAKLVEMAPAEGIKDKETVMFWYVQAYSLVYFLYRQHSRLQFFNFCRRLRDGNRLQDTLWEVYRFRDLPALETAWKEWLRQAHHAPRVSRGFVTPGGVARKRSKNPAATGWKLDRFETLGFHPLRGDSKDSKQR